MRRNYIRFPFRLGDMRTAVKFDDDTALALEQFRSESGMGVSEAVNCLVRRGLLAEPSPAPFVQQTRRLGLRIDVTNVAEAMESADSDFGRSTQLEWFNPAAPPKS